jgi:hypothetical protein
MEIMKQMLKARDSIDFAMFTFAQSSGVDDTMYRLVPPSIQRLRGVLDRGQGAQKWAATQPLRTAGVELYQNAAGNGVRKVHHKLMVIDSQLIIVGSFNYTDPANTLNDENIVILGDLETADSGERNAQAVLAEAALAEIERIIRDLCQPVPAARDRTPPRPDDPSRRVAGGEVAPPAPDPDLHLDLDALEDVALADGIVLDPVLDPVPAEPETHPPFPPATAPPDIADLPPSPND